MQGLLERSLIYQQQQAAIASEAATSIQAAWRARQARRLLQLLQASRQQSLKAAAAAGLIQVRLLIKTATVVPSFCHYFIHLFLPPITSAFILTLAHLVLPT